MKMTIRTTDQTGSHTHESDYVVNT